MGRVQWLNKPVRKKTSAGSISGRGLSTSNSRKMSDNIDSSNTSRTNSDNFDSHIYENTEIKIKPACEEVVSKDPLESRLDASEENNTENITEGHSEVLSKPKPLIEQQTKIYNQTIFLLKCSYVRAWVTSNNGGKFSSFLNLFLNLNLKFLPNTVRSENDAVCSQFLLSIIIVLEVSDFLF